MRVLVELALLALSPDTAEQVVILLSEEAGEAIKLGRDLVRRCRSLALFLCCGTFVGFMLPEPSENMLRTLVTALLGKLMESTSGVKVAGCSWSSIGKSPGSSAGRVGDGGSEYLDNGAADGLIHAVVFSPEVAGR